MSVLKYFKNTPRSPPHRATGPMCNFFSSNLQRGPWKKKGGCRPPRATSGPSPRARQGGLSPSPPRATGVCPPYISSNSPLPSSFEPENSTKNPEKKREVRKREAAKL